jgi:hypothetical protein
MRCQCAQDVRVVVYPLIINVHLIGDKDAVAGDKIEMDAMDDHWSDVHPAVSGGRSSSVGGATTSDLDESMEVNIDDHNDAVPDADGVDQQLPGLSVALCITIVSCSRTRHERFVKQ